MVYLRKVIVLLLRKTQIIEDLSRREKFLLLMRTSVIVMVFFFVTACSQAKVSLPKKELQQLANLYLSLSKIAKKRHVVYTIKKIENLQTKQEIATISTRVVDNYVLKTKKQWLKICESLLNYAHNNELDVLADDALFGALLASTSLSQADTHYSTKTIKIAKKTLITYSTVKIEESTIEILSKAPSLKWIFDSFALERTQGIISPERNYIARLIIVEYIRVGDIEGAYSMLDKLSDYNISKRLIVELKNYVDTAVDIKT